MQIDLNEDERKYYKISFDSNMNPEEAKKQKFTEEERLQYFDKYGEFFGSTTEKFVSVNNKISEFDSTAWINQQNIIKSDLTRTKQNKFYQHWMSELKEKAKIIDNRKYYF